MMEEKQRDLFPVIVSASRATDIPAFYTDWLLHRLKEGFVSWRNPFNQKVSRVLFEKTRMFVFWSKNPEPLLNRIDELHDLGYRNYYFQFTLNDYDAEGFEPRVPSVRTRIDTFRRLSEKIGKERVIWRFDPLMVTDTLSVKDLLDRAYSIGQKLKGYTEKLVFSFADIEEYRKVKNNVREKGIRELTLQERETFARGLAEMNRECGFQVATCAEGIDLESYGIEHNRCVDDRLIVRLFSNDRALMEYIGAEYDLLEGWKIRKTRKDKGQRKTCGCIVSKDIGMYNTCPHLCTYCYANASEELAMKNWKRHLSDPLSDMIVGNDTKESIS